MNGVISLSGRSTPSLGIRLSRPTSAGLYKSRCRSPTRGRCVWRNDDLYSSFVFHIVGVFSTVCHRGRVVSLSTAQTSC
ncbi:uncharacterized protein K452DRAFT_292058 [Aplosporella prunicola CBS 121167]|uniref:Uncharacterized protein n=1 Tax=Aplosporella prunicola CBS 121167 TaxID=1176127 RepID=A0A6A6AZX8_9PEZI|nr:uncharacterized protein K452DRAFT_292058 [Aplosporella prunicola CBS 121167]KAF2136828.1 hypothetical protein K452DRAFT_292058 [Aplosporella prunicola CBS 121167]